MTNSIQLKTLLNICLCSFCCCTHSQDHDPFYHVACQNTKAVKLWIYQTGNINIKDQSKTPLIISIVQSRNLSLLKVLLKQKNLDVNALDQKHCTALDHAVNLENINNDSPTFLQQLQYDICKLLVHYDCKVTSIPNDTKLRDLLLKGKPKHNTTMLGFCMQQSPALISQAATHSLPSFFGTFIHATASFTSSFVLYIIERTGEFRRFKKYNKSFLSTPEMTVQQSNA